MKGTHEQKIHVSGSIGCAVSNDCGVMLPVNNMWADRPEVNLPEPPDHFVNAAKAEAEAKRLRKKNRKQ